MGTKIDVHMRPSFIFYSAAARPFDPAIKHHSDSLSKHCAEACAHFAAWQQSIVLQTAVNKNF